MMMFSTKYSGILLTSFIFQENFKNIKQKMEKKTEKIIIIIIVVK